MAHRDNRRTTEAYVAHRRLSRGVLALTVLAASLVPGPTHGLLGVGSAEAGSTVIAGHRMTCPRATIIRDSSIGAIAYARPGRIVLNPRAMRRYPVTVRRMIFLHECAHHYVGGNEPAADCWAVRRAKREGWLTRAGLRQVCRSFENSRGGGGHLPGPARCRAMTRCFERG